MAYGQGAAAALPIAAMFLQKVYKDASLGYDPNAQFNIPSSHQDCNYYGTDSEVDLFGEEAFDEIML